MKGRCERKTGIEVVRGCVSPAAQWMRRTKPPTKRRWRPALTDFFVHGFAVCNVYWLQGKHMIGRGVKYFDEGIKGTILFLKQKRNTKSLLLTD